MAGDPELVAYYKEFFSIGGIRTLWQAAGAALAERKQDVTITAVQFVDGSTSGEVRGDPGEICRAARQAIDELTQEAAGAQADGIGNPYINFSRRVVGT